MMSVLTMAAVFAAVFMLGYFKGRHDLAKRQIPECRLQWIIGQLMTARDLVRGSLRSLSVEDYGDSMCGAVGRIEQVVRVLNDKDRRSSIMPVTRGGRVIPSYIPPPPVSSTGGDEAP